MTVRLKKMGLIFVAVYLCWFLIFTGLAVTTPDPTGAYLLGQMSILPAQLFLWNTGLGKLLEAHVPSDSWINSVFFTGPMSLLVVYLLGWGMGALRKPSKQPPGG
jgi:hypothetical protein